MIGYVKLYLVVRLVGRLIPLGIRLLEFLYCGIFNGTKLLYPYSSDQMNGGEMMVIGKDEWEGWRRYRGIEGEREGYGTSLPQLLMKSLIRHCL